MSVLKIWDGTQWVEQPTATNDPFAFHTNEDREFEVPASVSSVDGADHILLETNASAGEKRHIDFSDFEASVDHDATTNFVANEHIDHSGVSISAGDGLSGGGDLTATRTVDLDIQNLTQISAFSSDNDILYIYDDSISQHRSMLLRDARLVTMSVANTSGSAIPILTPVYLSGFYSPSQTPLVEPADADDTTKVPVIGITMAQINNNNYGDIISHGIVKCDTSAYSLGDLLYLDTTAGAFSTSPPSDGIVQLLGIVTDVGASFAGRVWVNIQPPQPRQHYPISIANPGSSEDRTIAFTEKALTISEMRAVLVGSSTPSVTWTVRHSTDRSAAGNEVVTSGTTTTSVTSGSDVTSFNDATVPADSFLWLETTAQSGTVNELHVTVVGTEDL